MSSEASKLTDQILDLLNASKLDIDDHIGALISSLVSVLGSITCRECRQLTCENIEDALPAVFEEAMQRPATEEHLH